MSDSKKKDDRSAPRSGAVVPDDSTTAELATWLHKMWARDNPPERIEVWQVFNPHKSVRGERIYAEDYKPHDKKDIEQCTKIANEIVGTAQNDCDAVRRQQDYQIAVLDRHRAAGPTIRRLGPYFPKITYLTQQQKGKGHALDGDGDDFEQPHNWRALALREIELSQARVQFGEQRNDAVLGDLLRGYRDTVIEQRTWLSGLMVQQMQFFKELQSAKNEEVDRMVARKRAEMTTAVMEEGMKVVRTLLPMLIKKDTAPALGDGNEAKPAPAADRDYGISEERSHVTNFLEDCDKAKLMEILFGEWETTEGRPRHVSGGVFQPEQFLALYGVSIGKLPPAALDALMPWSGHRLAITDEQMAQAQDKLPDTLKMSIAYIIGLRETARQAATSATTKKERRVS